MKKLLTLTILLLTFFSFTKNYHALNNITINNQKLIPDFDKNLKVYNVFVNSKTEIVTINVSPEEGEVITGSGSKSLKKGNNEIEILTYKNDLLYEKYTLNIVRGEIKNNKSEAVLKNLTIENHELEFESNTYYYNLDALDEEERLNITYEASNPESTVKLKGDVNLKKEKNIIKISVTSEDKKVTNTYKIVVNKKIKSNKTTEKKESIFDRREFNSYELKMIIIGIVLLILTILGILFWFIFIKKRTNKVPSILLCTPHK